MNYNQAISFLYSSLPMYQRVGKVAYKSSLKTTLALDEYFGHPHQQFKSIHIAGTNGKGSVGHMLAAVCQSAGLKTGLYTSPHLKDFRERIRVDGNMIPEENVTRFVNEHKEIIDKITPSFFEMTVAMAFDHFATEKVDIAIVEVGMGGRLDSTNIIRPLISMITNIGLDHSQFLGNTMYKIATEKAGIIKEGIPVIVGEKQESVEIVFKKKAKELKCDLHFAGDEYRVEYALQSNEEKQLMQIYHNDSPWGESLEVDLLGMYQQKNVASVLKAVELLNEMGIPVSEKNLRQGMSDIVTLTGLRGRWETLGHNPRIICDTAHNAEGMNEVVRQLRQTPYKKLHFVLGMVNDKDPGKLLSKLPVEAKYYFTEASIPRAMDREELATEALKYGLYGRIYGNPRKALQVARSNAAAEDMIYIGGSTFIVAEVL